MNYQKQLLEKTIRLQTLLSPYTNIVPTVYSSRETHFRMRAEFRLWRDNDGIHYAMTSKGQKLNPETVIRMTTFPIACEAINVLMPRLLDALKADDVLCHKLYQIEFLATLTGDMLVTLIYHRRLDDAWLIQATQLETTLNCAIVGRSRGQKIIVSRDFVREQLTVEGRVFHYLQYEQSFSQPNAEMCQYMLEWAVKHAPKTERDLLELYCGNGNFTLPLSQQFRSVLATEMSKTSIAALRENLRLNDIHTIAVARLSAEEFTQAYRGERQFNRLKQDNITLSDYDFSTVFVDPPRAGIDEGTLSLLSEFERIIYVSCNPETLAANLSVLSHTHTITAMALFDQFPYTDHIESGVVLEQKQV